MPGIKRKRSYVPTKFRRFRRRFKRPFKSRRVVTFTHQAPGAATTFRLRNKRTSRRVYKRDLWKSTQYKPKYRSFNTIRQQVLTPASYYQIGLSYVSMYGLTAPGFWTAAGGAFSPDPANALPTFDENSIVIRGGACTATFVNEGTENMRVTVQVIWTKNKPDLTPILAGIRDRAWTFNLAPNAADCGRLVTSKTVLLQPQESFEFQYKLGLQKIDESNYNAGGLSPLLLILHNNLQTNVAQTLTISMSTSISFVGDART